MIPLEAPITLGRDEARRQFEAELAKPEYLDTENAWDQWLDRLLDWLSGGPTINGDLEIPIIPTIVTVLVLAALAILIVRAGPIRRNRITSSEQDMFADITQNAAQLREEAATLGAAGQWTQAYLQQFRAIIRSLSERDIIEESSGMTAYEAAVRAHLSLPSFRDQLLTAANTFDRFAYGNRTGTQSHFEQLALLDTQLLQVRPLALDETEPLDAGNTFDPSKTLTPQAPTGNQQ